jgi:Arc/MetJ family transcription regulator
MRTTLDVDEKMIEEAERLTGEKSGSKVVNRALADLIRRERAKALIASLGNWDLDLDDWYEFRHKERG